MWADGTGDRTDRRMTGAAGLQRRALLSHCYAILPEFTVVWAGRSTACYILFILRHLLVVGRAGAL